MPPPPARVLGYHPEPHGWLIREGSGDVTAGSPRVCGGATNRRPLGCAGLDRELGGVHPALRRSARAAVRRLRGGSSVHGAAHPDGDDPAGAANEGAPPGSPPASSG